MWMPRFACPECSVDILDASADVCGCARCGNRYAHDNGLWRFLTPARSTALEPFVRQYRAVREQDCRRRASAEYYRALRYAPRPAATLAAACRMLSTGGGLAVMDSPMFARDGDGRAMAADVSARFESECGVSDVVRTGPGYLTYASLDAVAATLGLRSEFLLSRGSIGWRLRRWRGGIRLGRAPAAFGLWIGKEREGFSRA